jgi:mRNA interferase RelE/StbE
MTKPLFEVVFKKSALKELEKVPSKIQQKILDAVQLLALNPHTELLQIKKLKGADDLYRFRIQDYRIIYTINEAIIQIAIIKIGVPQRSLSVAGRP